MLQNAWKLAIQDFKLCVSVNIKGSLNTQNQKIEDQINSIADDPLFKRLNLVTTFRSEHHKLEQVIQNTFGKDEKDSKGAKSNVREEALRDMKGAYEVFVKTVNVLDYKPEGVLVWDAAKKIYETATSKIES